jgi:hypothetical protein
MPRHEAAVAANIRHSSESNEHLTPLWLVKLVQLIIGHGLSGLQIDGDPCSSKRANRDVQAGWFYTAKRNGLLHPWNGVGAYAGTYAAGRLKPSFPQRVMVNPAGGLVDANGITVVKAAGGRPGCKETGACGLPIGHIHPRPTSSAGAWWKKSIDEWVAGHIDACFFIGFSLELLQIAQSKKGYPQPLDFDSCLPSERVCFDTLDAEGNRISGDDPTHSNVLTLITSDEELKEKFRHYMAPVGYVHHSQQRRKQRGRIAA